MFYSYCKDAELAALLSGSDVDIACEEGMVMLSDRQVKRQLDKLMREKRRLYSVIRDGLEKLAFSRCNDAVELAFADRESITHSLIRKMDLSCVASIKRDKDGGVDIKLFDRERALEALMQLEDAEANNNAESFLKALGAVQNADNGEQSYDEG